MLILTRNVNQKIKINDDITIEVLSVRGNQVSLGITAPREHKVYREEIYDKIKEDNSNECQDIDYLVKQSNFLTSVKGYFNKDKKDND